MRNYADGRSRIPRYALRATREIGSSDFWEGSAQRCCSEGLTGEWSTRAEEQLSKAWCNVSVYQINKLLYLTDNDPAFRKRMKEEPEKVLSEFKLTAEEHAALTSGAVGKLYQMGVHTFLLNHLYRYELFGVNRDNYLSRIREGMRYDPRFERGNMPVQRFIKTKP